LLAGLEIRREHPLQVILKRRTDVQHCLKVVAPGTGHKLALVGGMGDLVQVAADAPKLADGALESQQLLFRQRRKRVLRRDKDRTKTQEDRDVELCPRAIEVLQRHLALRAEYLAAGKIAHEHLFFLEDGRPISDPEITRWRWSESSTRERRKPIFTRSNRRWKEDPPRASQCPMFVLQFPRSMPGQITRD
jgi:hypothetical protein